MTLSLLIVADTPAAGAIERTLTSLDFFVRRSPSGSTAIELALQSPPDLILVDARDDPMNCLQLCRSLRSIEETYPLPLIVLSGPASAQERLRILESGADDCWTEPVDSREFQLRLKAFSRRFDNISASPILRYADVELDLDRYRARRNGTLIGLTAMQMKLLRHLMENPTVIFSHRELLERVWENPDLDEGAVTACVVRLRRALNAAGGPNIIKNVPCAGYALDAEADAV